MVSWYYTKTCLVVNNLFNYLIHNRFVRIFFLSLKFVVASYEDMDWICKWKTVHEYTIYEVNS